MSSIRLKRSGSGNLDARSAKKSLVIKFPVAHMSLVDAVDIAARYNETLFAKHTQEESLKARMTISSAFSAKYIKLDKVIEAQDLAIEQSKAVIAALDRLIQNFDTLPSRRIEALLPGSSVEMLATILQSFNAVNSHEQDAQKQIIKNAEKTRVVANAAKMMLADREKRYLLLYFVTPIASRGCGVEIGNYTGLAATQRTARTWAAKFAMEEMFRVGEIDRWWEADTAEVDGVMAIDLGSLF
ncbi:uncharacterized protein EAF01_001887 [Botrytis porri]|uniref:Uncharacterized protein n=1 Tax=Botrytis porri TaxID=87229 RepID=A0A4Z1KLH3_9HELO|nr:uncharacterized protein EAF01_001887 [Botrytis porri]KAF7912866.1 hypothetical protein EAF01_001887 [Botrytis porri]TGO84434.1 hypothetical protein BPOR_0505g00070 [Botrytis porri]